ncbi:hypothetical protein B0T22DRAFT_86473 [Podospora appendiculata]|uniref:Zn(2)-C6 fungal-type domain-containing protein n=1 Tax=Podospora appendiculata TaxID=314037 RepID=A0AAE1CHU4_9PEZI|nr:hypothetical protein B0T22DRAFT_86473 [Podospora appendiculata]
MSAASASQPPSPESVTLKSPRVCLNCRRKKKACDKGLPSCSRCIESRQVCLHEEDVGGSSTPGSHRFSPMMGQYVSPIEQHLVGGGQHQPGWSTLSPSLFASMDSVEDIHSFIFRCLSEIAESRQGVELAVSSYFADVNTWFTIIERATFERQLEDMWVNPSAETGVLVLCMRLITRSPITNPISGMGDRHYLSAKTMLNLVQSKVPAFSIQLLQAELLVALYECSHGMPQQAYMSVGNCCQISRALGWHNKAFWSLEQQSLGPRQLKLCSILWWAIVYVDCLVHVGYQDQKYPLHTTNFTHSPCDSSIPFPEALDRYLPGSLAFNFHHGHHGFLLDPELAQIDGLAWPEANSAGYLRTVLHHLSPSNPNSPPPTIAERNSITELIMGHTINLLAGKRTAAVGANFIALMKINHAGLLVHVHPHRSGASAVAPAASASATASDLRPIETIRSVIDSVYSESHQQQQALAAATASMSSGGSGSATPSLRSWAPCGAFAAYYAALLLISHGDGVLHDQEWLIKVEGLKKTLEIGCRRWKVAEKYLEGVNIALSNRLGGYTG